MLRYKIPVIILALLLLSTTVYSQQQNFPPSSSGNGTTIVTSNPATCTSGNTFYNSVTGAFLICSAANTLVSATPAWSAILGGSTNVNTGFVHNPTVTSTSAWSITCPASMSVDCWDLFGGGNTVGFGLSTNDTVNLGTGNGATVNIGTNSSGAPIVRIGSSNAVQFLSTKIEPGTNVNIQMDGGGLSFTQVAEKCVGFQPANSACFESPASVTTAYSELWPPAKATNNNSAMLFSNATPGVGAFAKMPQTGMVTAQQATLTAVANLPGLSFSVEASTKYVMTCTLYYQVSATTANLSIAITGPASPTFVSYSLFDTDTATGVAESGVATAFATTLSGSGTSTATTNFPATVTMGLSNGTNAGTVQVQAGAVGTGNSTIQTGSFCVMQ